MKKLVILLFVLLVNMSAWAELKSRHFFKTLKSEELTEEKAVESFSQWFVLPQETEWRRVGERTDRLGMTRVEYRQYLSGVEVEYSQVLLHMKDGHVQTANGTVMEAQHAPARVRRYAKVYRDGTPTDLMGRKLYLVSTKEGYRYATKVLSSDRKEWIYTDVETQLELKRIPTHRNLASGSVKVTGRSIYSGEVLMDVWHDEESGIYTLVDQERKIYTVNGAVIPSFYTIMFNDSLFHENFPNLEGTLPVPAEDMTAEMWRQWLRDYFWPNFDCISFVSHNAAYATSTEPYFDSYDLSTLTIDRVSFAEEDGTLTGIVPSRYNPLTLNIKIQYPNTDGLIERTKEFIGEFPLRLNLRKYFDEIPSEGVDIHLYAIFTEKVDKNDVTKEILLETLHLVPNESGHAEWETKQVTASATYEKGPWSAVDIHWGMQQTYDFYKNIFGRESFDDNGAPVYNLFYLPDDGSYILSLRPDNAAAYSKSVMVYGMGSRSSGILSMSPVVELSVTAHEYTHLVDNTTADLAYQGESGALSESFADQMGISVKKYVKGNDASWVIGEGLLDGYSGLRSMSFPKLCVDGEDPSPDTYKGEFWADTEDSYDHGGVHINSGVPNKWYYLLTDGGSGTNDNDYSYQVDGIGIEKSRQISYRAVTEYATSESQFADFRLASLQAAEDLFGENAPEVVAVDEAWKAVGVNADEEQTAIRDILETASRKQTIAPIFYDLTGRKVQNPQDGIYIVNGKKILYKSAGR